MCPVSATCPKKARPILGSEEPASNSMVPSGEEESNNGAPSTNINDLPDELLGRVIRELEPKHRVLIERVCHRWNRVSRAYGWLDFRLVAEDQWNYRSEMNWLGHRDREPDDVVEGQLKCFISRCPPTVREINFAGIRDYGLDGRVCELLSSEMTKLETLILDGVPLNSCQLAIIGERLPKLKAISLEWCFEDPENSRMLRAVDGVQNAEGASKALASLLTSCGRLETLNLNWNPNLTARLFLSTLPSTIRRLDISRLEKICPSVVDSLLATCAGNLMDLHMGYVQLDGWTNRHMERLFTGLRNLEELDFGELLKDRALGEEDVTTRLNCLGALKKLRRLKLRCNANVTSEVGSEEELAAISRLGRIYPIKVLGSIVDGCRKLESLELLSCRNANISKIAVSRLAQLPELTRLRLWWHPSIDDETLAEMAKGPAQLRELDISGCKKVTDRGISHLLEGCGGQLHDLDVEYCPLISWETVARLEALYNDSSSSGTAEKSRVFVLRADYTTLGFSYREFRRSRLVK